MNELNKIITKNPLEIADDDHPDRKDISAEEFSAALNAMKKKYGQQHQKNKKDIEFADQMLKGSIDALNK